jgi:hypothetical protein
LNPFEVDNHYSSLVDDGTFTWKKKSMIQAQASHEWGKKSEKFQNLNPPNQHLYSFLCTTMTNLKCIIHAKTITHVKGDKRAKESSENYLWFRPLQPLFFVFNMKPNSYPCQVKPMWRRDKSWVGGGAHGLVERKRVRVLRFFREKRSENLIWEKGVVSHIEGQRG